MIAIFIKTSPARRSLLWVLNSIEIHFKNIDYRLYIYDESPLDDWKKKLYAELINDGHFLYVSESQVSVGVARNFLIKNLKDELFVLRLDDDFELGGEFSISAMLKILSRTDIDFCSDVERQIGSGRMTPSGQVRIRAGEILFEESGPTIRLHSDAKWAYADCEGVRYARADYMRNLILIKRHCFDRVSWNERLQFMGEHEDFYLSLKSAGYVGAFTPDSIHLHRDDIKSLCVDLVEEGKWRGKESEARLVTRSIFKEQWGGIPRYITKEEGLYPRLSKIFSASISKIVSFLKGS